MLFEVYWSGMQYPKTKLVDLATVIKEAPPEDSFVFIITGPNLNAYHKWVLDNGLPVAYETARQLTNLVHDESGRNLTLSVLGKTPMQPKVYKERAKRKAIKEVLIGGNDIVAPLNIFAPAAIAPFNDNF